jgi:amino acid adenylation domain-containing protein
LSFHPAILDRWSLSLLLDEVLRAHYATLNGIAANPPAALPYRDYVDWAQERNGSRAESYWRRRFEGFAAPTPLTVGHYAAAAQPATPGTLRSLIREISGPTTEMLNSAARTHEIPRGAFLQGAWALLLSRYASVDEVVFGIVTAGRPPALSGAKAMVGLFANTLPLRLPTGRGTMLLPWLRSLQEQVVETMEYAGTPLGLVEKWSGIASDQRLFESVVDVSDCPAMGSQPRPSALSVIPGWLAKASNNGHALALAVTCHDPLRLEITFDRRRFDDITIERMLGHLQVLLSGMAENLHRAIDDLPLLDEHEQAELIAGINRTNRGLPEPRLPADGGEVLHKLFEDQAARRPEAVALTCDGESLTYRQLNARANHVARRLVEWGVRPEVLVGLCLERSNDLVVALLAILKAGGAYLPIDLAYPAERIAFILEDAQAPVLLTHTNLKGSLPSTRANVVCVDEVLANAPPDGEGENLPHSAGPDNLAYVIYTSGTTGKPKGSLITHRNVTRLFAATEHWYHFDDRDTWTLFHSCAFDFSVWEIWGALLYGGRLVVVPFMTSRSPESFCDLLISERVTVLNQTPSAFRQLIQAEGVSGSPQVSLRYVIFGGEALEMRSLRPWFERHGDMSPRLINMYGITETTVHVTYRPLSKEDLDSGSVIGVPIPDLQVYILDSRRRPVPVGVPGEMYVGGLGLGRGYLRRPDLTSERFVPDHLTGRPESRLYRTGDMARLLPGGDIEYLGRIDHQVKIRGFRIELGEIESVLAEHPLVREAMVFALDDQQGAKRLVGYIVSSQPVPDAGSLRQHLKQKLPPYMVPPEFVFLEKFPLTTSGKIDRAALPLPGLGTGVATRTTGPQTAQTDIERTVADVWRATLGFETGVEDNFFDVGGHSLLLVQIQTRLREALQKEIPIVSLFEHPTIRSLARYLKEPEQAASEGAEVCADRAQLQKRAMAQFRVRSGGRPT